MMDGSAQTASDPAFLSATHTIPGSDWYARDVVTVARDLLGAILIVDGAGGMIVETEAYHEDEEACHAHGGRTGRAGVLFNRPGTSYVYLIYGMYHCVNAVCEPAGVGAAVLIRAIEPRYGMEMMHKRRSRDLRSQRRLHDRELCSGPGKLCRALGINEHHNELNLTDQTGPTIWVPRTPADHHIVAGPRIGISKAVDLPWRFGIADSPWLSRKFQA